MGIADQIRQLVLTGRPIIHMPIKRNISIGISLRYSWKNLIFFSFWAGLVFSLYYVLGWTFIDIPFEPLSVIGIAVAFDNDTI